MVERLKKLVSKLTETNRPLFFIHFRPWDIGVPYQLSYSSGPKKKKGLIDHFNCNNRDLGRIWTGVMTPRECRIYIQLRVHTKRHGTGAMTPHFMSRTFHDKDTGNGIHGYVSCKPILFFNTLTKIVRNFNTIVIFVSSLNTVFDMI